MKRYNIKFFMGLLFVFVFIFNMNSIEAKAETAVITEDSTYEYYDSTTSQFVEKKCLTFENNTWTGYYNSTNSLKYDSLKIIIPDGITTITTSTIGFDFRKSTEVVLPKSVKTIGEEAFQGNRNLVSINLENVTNIGKNAFRNAIYLGESEDYKLELNSITQMGDSAFAQCYYITSVTIGGGLKKIPDNAFSMNHRLSYVKIEDGVKQIGASSFGKNNGISTSVITYKITVEIPKSVTKIEDSFFSDEVYREEINKKVTFITPKNSYAYKYAVKNGIKVQTGIKPSKVTNLSVKDNSTKSVTINYDKADNAKKYIIYKLVGKEYEAIKTTTATRYKITGLASGKAYTFKVVAVNGDEKSDGVTIKTATSTDKPTISGIKKKSSKVKLNWKKVSGASGYEIYMSNDGKNYEKVKSLSKASYTTSKLSKGTYQFKIRTYKKVGNVKIYSKYSTVKKIKL